MRRRKRPHRFPVPDRARPAPATPEPGRDEHAIVRLQQAVGNQAVLRMLRDGHPAELTGPAARYGLARMLRRRVADAGGGQRPVPPVPGVQRSTLDQSASQAERKNIQVLTIESVPEISKDELKALFTGKDKVSAPVDDVQFGPGIDAKLEHGLKNVAGTIYDPTNKSGFRFNSLTNVPLNLTPFGGVNGVYRFTLVERKTQPKRQLIVELVTSKPPPTSDKIDISKHEKRLDKYEFKLGSGFSSDAMQKRLYAALERVPISTLERIRGVTFVYDARTEGDAGEAGHYDPNKHTIMFFKSSLDAMINSADALGADHFTYTVAHEIGHAVDYESFTLARLKVASLTKKLKEARTEARKIDINADDRTREAKSAADKAKIKQLESDLDQAHADFNKAVKDLDLAKGGAHTQSKGFKDASKGKAISKYGGGAAVENFAELYSLYILDPKLLQSLRPEVYQHFAKTFP
jgi:hypothetical protein